MYLYESHMGGVYVTPYEIDSDTLYCSVCADSDFLIGEFDTAEQVKAYLIEDGAFTEEYIREVYEWAKQCYEE